MAGADGREEGSWQRSGRGLIRKISLHEQRQAHLTEARSPRKGAARGPLEYSRVTINKRVAPRSSPWVPPPLHENLANNESASRVVATIERALVRKKSLIRADIEARNEGETEIDRSCSSTREATVVNDVGETWSMRVAGVKTMDIEGVEEARSLNS